MTGAEVDRMIVRLMGDGSHYERMLKDAERATTTAAAEIERQAKRISMALSAMVAGGAAASLREFGKFDKAMTESTSIMLHASEQQMSGMREQALELSTISKQTPAEIAKAYYFLASAGFSAEQSLAAMPKLLEFATAGAFDLAEATSYAADAQSALGLRSADAQKNVETLARVTDVLVSANVLANANVQQFSKSLTSGAASAMKVMNKDVEEGVAVLAAFADRGIKAENAGHVFQRMILLLSKASRDAAKDHERLGFRVFDAAGNMRNMADIMENLEQIMEKMPPEARAATLELLGFEARVQGAILPLVGASKSIREYEAELRKAGGTTKTVSDRQLAAFSNQMTIVMNNIRVMAVEIGAVLAPIMVKIGVVIKNATGYWRGLSDETKRMAIAAAGIAGVLLALAPAMGIISVLGPAFLSAVNPLMIMARLLGGLPMLLMSFAKAGLLLAPVVLIVLALSAAVQRFLWNAGSLENAWDEITKGAGEAWEYVLEVAQEAMKWIGDNLQPLFASAAATFLLSMTAIVKAIQYVVSSVTKWVGKNDELVQSAAGIALGLAAVVIVIKTVTAALSFLGITTTALKFIQVAGIGVWWLYTAAVVACKAAIWLVTAAYSFLMGVMTVTGLVSLLAAVVALTLGWQVLIGTFEAVSRAGRGAAAAIKGIPTDTGPVRAMMDLFSEWKGIILDVAGAVRVDMTLAFKLAQAAAALAVSQIKDHFPPLWEFIKTGFMHVAETIRAIFSNEMDRVTDNISYRLQIAEKIFKKDKDRIRAEMEQMNKDRDDANKSFLNIASKNVAHAAGKVNATESPETKRNRGEVNKVREEIKKAKDWMDTESELFFEDLMDLTWHGDFAGDFWDFSTSTAGKAGETAGETFGETFTKEAAKEIKKVDAVIAGSAEAIARYSEYLERLDEGLQGKGKKEKHQAGRDALARLGFGLPGSGGGVPGVSPAAALPGVPLGAGGLPGVPTPRSAATAPGTGDRLVELTSEVVRLLTIIAGKRGAAPASI